MIKPGEHYLYISGIWEGEPSSYHRCPDCQHIRCEIRRDRGDEYCMAINGLLSWLEEYGDRRKDSPWQRWAGMFNAVATMRESRRRITITIDPDYPCPTTQTPAAVVSNSGDTPECPSPSGSDTVTPSAEGKP